MRKLTLNETLTVNGAGYAEDIVATAATLYVGGCLYSVGLGFAKAGFAAAAGLGAAAPLATAAALISPVAALAVPAAVASLVLANNPEFGETLEAKYHQYFG